MPICLELSTPRLLLRPWRTSDAAELEPILMANEARLRPWIPLRIAEAAPLPQLVERIAGFEREFEADREWRYAMFTRADSKLLGEFGLFPRSPVGRVRFADADRVEMGYWLRADATGQGYVTEAARAMLAVVEAIPQFRCVEIRCDPQNAPSAAVPQRLGFSVVQSVDEHGLTQVWMLSPNRHSRFIAT